MFTFDSYKFIKSHGGATVIKALKLYHYTHRKSDTLYLPAFPKNNAFRFLKRDLSNLVLITIIVIIGVGNGSVCIS